MIPIVGMFRGLFLGSVLVWYSSSVWKTMDNYYNHEFKKYLQKEKQERHFPSEEEVCRAAPDAPCAAAVAAHAQAHAHDATERGGAEEALGQITAPEPDTSGADDGGGGGGGGGGTVSSDVTHMGEWRRRVQEETLGKQGTCTYEGSEDDDDGGTCPAEY